MVFIWTQRRGASPAEAAPGAVPASAAAELAAGAPQPKPGEPVVIRDVAAVFQRAFWRRPSADIRVLEGERREWLNAQAAVEKWQWFVGVQTSADFRTWLLEQNPFELIKDTKPFDAADIENAPAWLPAAVQRGSLTSYRSRGSKLVVLLDQETGKLFASDRGAGFAAPVR